MPQRKKDGLTKWQRYRLKDVDAYRTKKAAYARTPEERAKRTAYMRLWREANREKHNRLARESHARNKHKHIDKRRDYDLRSKFGIGLVEKARMVVEQEGRCLICGKEFLDSRRTHIDHCHKTGKVRGILCNTCNTKLGWLETYPDQIGAYLKRFAA
jgi:hypothetical protein